MIVHDMDQRTPEWHKARLGKFTASRAKDMLATIKSGEAAARRDLKVQLVLERLTGQPQEGGYVNSDMQRGTDMEPDAFAAYEALTGELALPVGFVSHDSLMAGCSPDGRVGNFRGVLELKCPKSATHLGYLKGRSLPSDYRGQVTHAMWITGAEFCDFVSFDDRFPADLQLFHVRVKRGDVDIAAYELMSRLFLDEVDREYQQVLSLREAVAAA